MVFIFIQNKCYLLPNYFSEYGGNWLKTSHQNADNLYHKTNRKISNVRKKAYVCGRYLPDYL